jgi:hypothetical protein
MEFYFIFMRSDLSEHYCSVQKGMKNHIRVIWTQIIFHLPKFTNYS